MNANQIIQSTFYVFGIIFFIIIIITAIYFMVKVRKTSNQIKKLIDSQALEDLINKIKEKMSYIL